MENMEGVEGDPRLLTNSEMNFLTLCYDKIMELETEKQEQNEELSKVKNELGDMKKLVAEAYQDNLKETIAQLNHPVSYALQSVLEMNQTTQRIMEGSVSDLEIKLEKDSDKWNRAMMEIWSNVNMVAGDLLTVSNLISRSTAAMSNLNEKMEELAKKVEELKGQISPVKLDIIAARMDGMPVLVQEVLRGPSTSQVMCASSSTDEKGAGPGTLSTATSTEEDKPIGGNGAKSSGGRSTNRLCHGTGGFRFRGFVSRRNKINRRASIAGKMIGDCRLA